MKNTAILYMKGLAMGAADVVPGVSGGTVAFISGIYERLIDALKSFELGLVPMLFKEGIPAVWKKIDGTFLVTLFAGILTSIFTLAKAVSWTMANYPQLLWAFFFGLVIASALFVSRQIQNWASPSTIASFIIGVIVAYVITILPSGNVPDAYWMWFLAGAIAICAMILPGISGSFILLLMGMYPKVLNAVHTFDFGHLFVFALGCLIGLTSFSHVLSWTFKHYHNVTMALLTGFMIGSLNKVWPWQNEVQEFVIEGEKKGALMENVLPANYSGDPMVLMCLLLVVVGFVAVMLLEKLGEKSE